MGFGNTLADAFIRIRPDMDNFSGDLRTKAEAGAATAGLQAGKSFGKGLMSGIGAVVALGAVIGFFKTAFNEAQESVKVTKLTEAALKSTGGQAKITGKEITDLAGRLSNMAGVDDELIQSSENVLLTFTRVRNEAGKGNDVFNQGTEAALNLSVALGTDLQAATILVGKALNDPIGGLVALKKAGIQFTDAQRETITTMVKTGDTMGAQKIILRELTTEFGGAAEAAATPADKARVAWQNFEEMIGNKLLPTLNSLFDFGLRNQKWLVPMATTVAELALVIGAVIVATKAWTATQSALGFGLERSTNKTAIFTTRLFAAAAALDIVTAATNAAFNKDLSPKVEALGDDLVRLAKTGIAGGEAARLFGGDMKHLNVALANATSSGKSFSLWMEGHIPFAQAADSSWTKNIERINAMDQALAGLVAGGHAADAAEAFAVVRRQAEKQGISVNALKDAFPEYSAALSAAEKATTGLAGAADGAAEAGETLLHVWDRLHGQILTTDEAMLVAKNAVIAVKDAFETGSKSIVGNSTAALENRIALEKAARAAFDAATQYEEAGGSVAGAEKIMRDFEKATLDAANASGKDRVELKKLADQLFAIPKNITSNVKINVSTQDFIGPVLRRTVGDQPSNFIGPVQRRAMGGSALAGHDYMVGENGPELLHMGPDSGMVIPNGGMRIDKVEIRAYTDRFSLLQVQQELAMHGVH